MRKTAFLPIHIPLALYHRLKGVAGVLQGNTRQ